jgi:hypothetical protein
LTIPPALVDYKPKEVAKPTPMNMQHLPLPEILPVSCFMSKGNPYLHTCKHWAQTRMDKP